MKTIKLVNNFNHPPTLCFTYTESNRIKYYNKNEMIELLNYKNKIDSVSSHKIWDNAKKLTNDYELIHLPNRKYKFQSIAEYEPLSRSYFKLWEIIFDFEIFEDFEDKISIAGLAEGPGGFIEAINNYRNIYYNIKDNIYGITLKSSNKDVPGWNKANYYLKRNKHIKINYGKDNTGNIYILDNILHFNEFVRKYHPQGIIIITADGGFDFSSDFNNQEKLSQKLIFCEIITALTIQKKGGCFICKFFDLYTHISISFIYLLSCFYEDIYINKPLTSRPANSEKYIIAKKFIGISDNYLSQLQSMINDWEIIDLNNWNILSIFKQDIPIDFINNILKYNSENCSMQINNIKKTLQYISEHKKLDDTKNYQSKIAQEWCNKYKIKVNKNSSFI